LKNVIVNRLRSGRASKSLFYASLCVIILVVAGLIRVRAAFNDLWLDEIWSLESVRELHSPLQVFTKIHFDNNHYLNSLFVYFFGQRGNWPGYRLPAVVFGFGTIVLAWLIGLRWGKATASFSMLLVSFSYVMILYSSEARGYAPLIFFCFLCFLVLQSFLDRPRWRAAALFSICAILGFTSHLTFLTFLCASLIWFWARSLSLKFSLRRIAGWTAACYAAPLIYVLAIYFIDIRYLQIGGGTPISTLDGYGATLAWTLGGPNDSPLQIITEAISVAGLLVGFTIVLRERADLFVFFLAVITVMPLAMSLLEHGTLHYVRYFIVALGFLLLLFGRVLGWLYERGAGGKIACGLFCSLFLVLNGWDVAALLKYGRGHISEAIQFMAEGSKQESVITFGGEQDFRILFVLSFYTRETMPGKAMEYYEHERWPTNGPQWVIFHRESFRQPVPPGHHFYDKFHNWFELTRIYPTAPLSGVHWFIYRKISKDSAVPRE
jgi:Dolichyl-phosphate-mannose-protein mannosyltransferase